MTKEKLIEEVIKLIRPDITTQDILLRQMNVAQLRAACIKVELSRNGGKPMSRFIEKMRLKYSIQKSQVYNIVGKKNKFL